MKSLLTLLLWLTSSQVAPQQSGTERISGTVMRGDTQTPLPYTRLELIREDYARRSTGYEKACRPQLDNEVMDQRRFVTADANGKFTFENIVPSRYYLMAEHEGFLRTAYGQRGRFPLGTVLTIGPQPEAVPMASEIDTPRISLQALDISMVPAPAIAGSVFGENSQPLPAATVQAYEFRYTPMNGRTLWSIRATLTNDEGAFRLFWLNPGRYIIAAGYSVYGLQPWTSGLTFTPNLPSADAGYPVSFYPVASTAADAVPVRLDPGMQPLADLRLPERLRFTVRARLVSERPVPGATLVFVPAGGDLCAAMDYSISAKDDGTFEVRDVPEGIYVAVATRGRDVISDVTTLEVDGLSANAVEIPVSPPTEVRGNVYFKVMPQGIDIGAMRVNLTRTGQELSQVATAVVDPSTLRFSIPGVGPGSYYPSLDLPPGFYVQSVGASKFDPQSPGNCSSDPSLWSPSYTYMDGHGHLNPTNPIRVPGVIPNAAECLAILVNYGLPVVGEVRDRAGKAVAGALVVAIPKSVWTQSEDRGATPPDRYLTGTTDGTGRFQLYGATESAYPVAGGEGMVPQEYHLYAFEDIDPNMIYDPGFTERFRGRESFVLRTESRIPPGPWRPIRIGPYNHITEPGDSCFGELANGSLRRICILTSIPAEEAAGNR